MAGLKTRSRTSAASTVTTTCMLLRPVCTIRAVTSIRSPFSMGRVKCTFPT